MSVLSRDVPSQPAQPHATALLIETFIRSRVWWVWRIINDLCGLQTEREGFPCATLREVTLRGAWHRPMWELGMERPWEAGREGPKVVRKMGRGASEPLWRKGQPEPGRTELVRLEPQAPPAQD